MEDIDRAGRFKARISEVGFSNKEGSEAVQWWAKCHAQEFFDEQQQQWVPWSEYDQGITAFLNIIKKDGTPNDSQIKNLIEALGWDGVDFAWLDTVENFSDKIVQITCEYQEYNGKTSLRVAWLNPENFEGVQLKKLDASQVKSLNARYGSMLRAIAPPKQAATAPAPGAAKAPAKAPPPAPAKRY